MASTRKRECVECGAPLSALRRKRHANTCSATCAYNRQRRNRTRPIPAKTKPTVSPPILGLTLVEAAERIGIPHRKAHDHCVERGLGRRYNDGRWWLTLAELRELAERRRRGRVE